MNIYSCLMTNSNWKMIPQRLQIWVPALL